MNKNDVGRQIALNIGEDISAATECRMIFDHNKYNLTLGLADGVTRPNVNLTFTPCGSETEVTYLANQYLLYVTKAGDFPFSGSWQGRSQVVTATQTLTGDVANFIVDP